MLQMKNILTDDLLVGRVIDELGGPLKPPREPRRLSGDGGSSGSDSGERHLLLSLPLAHVGAPGTRQRTDDLKRSF